MASDLESTPSTSDEERGRDASAEPNKKSTEKRKRSRNWTDDETRILISVVRDHYPDLRKAKRNEHVYIRIHKEAVQLKLNRSLAEIKTKWKSLAATFKTEHAEHTGTGTSPSEWPFYEELSSFLGSIAINSHNVVESTSHHTGKTKRNRHRQSSSKSKDSSENSLNNSLSLSPRSSDSPLNTDATESIEHINGGASRSGQQLESPSNTGAAESNERINVGASTSGLQLGGSSRKKTTEEDFLSDAEKDETTPAKKRPKVASDKKKSSFQLIQDDIKESTAASIRFGDQMEKAFNVFTPLMQSIGQTLNSVLPQLVVPGNGQNIVPPSQPYQNHGHHLYGAPAYNPYNNTPPPNLSFNGGFTNGTHFAHTSVTDHYPYYNQPPYNNPSSMLNGSFSYGASQRGNEPPPTHHPPYNPNSMLNGSFSNEASQRGNEPPSSNHPPNSNLMLNGTFSNEISRRGNEVPSTNHPPNNPNSVLNGAFSSEMPPRENDSGTSGEYQTF